jgi:putative nucleotidyltransferase with HDIG domain/PAS domain S-box-containing protein
MENQVYSFVLVSSVIFGVFFLFTIYLVIKLKLNDIKLKNSRVELSTLNENLQSIVKESTDKLIESEMQFRSLYELNKRVLENSPAGIIKLDKSFNIEFQNPEMKKILFGTGHTDIQGKNITQIQGFKNEVHSYFFSLLENGKKATSEITFVSEKNKKLIATMEGVPILEKNKFDGAVLLVTNITSRILSEKRLKQSFEMLQKATEDIIQAMSSTSEMRDPYTAGHQKRVRELAVAIGNELGVEPDQLEGIRFAGIVHDIGKISVPSDILSKPGVISKMELEVIKSHSQVGYELLSKLEFPWPIADIVHQHHEKIDGTGYPNHLKRDEILLEAKIIAVADVVEAMTSHRPYRPALGIDVAIEEIKKRKNIYYEPEVVEACIKLFAEERFAFSKE